jgi:hypothetical protein
MMGSADAMEHPGGGTKAEVNSRKRKASELESKLNARASKHGPCWDATTEEAHVEANRLMASDIQEIDDQETARAMMEDSEDAEAQALRHLACKRVGNSSQTPNTIAESAEVDLRLDLSLLFQLLGCIEWEKTALKALEAARRRLDSSEELQEELARIIARDTDPERLWEDFEPPAREVLDCVGLDPWQYHWLLEDERKNICYHPDIKTRDVRSPKTLGT